MVDESILSLITAAFLDMLIFGGLFIGFIISRKLRSPEVEHDPDIKIRMPFILEGKYSFLDLAKKINRMSIDEVYASIGEWGFIYLTLQKYILYTLLAIASLACTVLIPIYLQGHSDVEESSNELGIAHVIKQSRYLVIPIVAIFLFTIFLYVFAAYYYKTAKYSVCESINPPQKYALVISKLPQNFPPEYLNRKIKKMLINKYGDGVLHVYTLPFYQPAYLKYLEMQECENKKKSLELKLKTTGKRKQVVNNQLKKVDGIEYYQEKIVELSKEVEELKLLGIPKNSGKAYVVCDNQRLVKEIIDFRVEKDNIIKTEDWRFKPASSPNDIIWKNIGTKYRFSSLSKFGYNALFLVLFLVILTPSSFNTVILDFFDSIGAANFVQGLIGIYLPSLLLLLYQQVILPEVVEFLVEKEGHAYRHDEISSGLRKYLFFLIFYIFLYPLLGLRFVELVEIFFDSSIDWEEELAKGINATGLFFTTFIVHQTFMKNGSDLLVIDKYLKAKARSLLASNDLEKALAFEADPFRFDFELAITINTFIIACSFSVVYPLILVPSLAFFALRYNVHKHNLLAVFYVDKDSSAYPTLFSVLCGITLAVFSLQVLTGTTLVLSGSHNYGLVAKIITPAGFCLLVLSILWFKVIVKRGKVDVQKESQSLIKVDIKTYYHPLEDSNKPLTE